MRRAFLIAALLLVPLAALAAGDRYFGYTYRNVEVTAAGSSAYAVNLARYCVRLDGLLSRILGIKATDRSPVHLYALPQAQVRDLLHDPDRVSYRLSPDGATILMSNVTAHDSEYWGAYFGYTAALLASDGRFTGPDWYRLGLPLVVAGTKYEGDRAHVGIVERGYGRTLGQGSARIPLRKFLGLKRAAIYEDEAARKIYDAEAWALAHEIFVEGWRRAEFNKYLDLMRNGTAEPDAFAASFNVTYEQLDKDFGYAIDRGRALVYTLEAPDPGAAGQTAEPLSAEDLRERLERLAKLYPKASAQ
jgi:hypothetical protein